MKRFLSLAFVILELSSAQAGPVRRIVQRLRPQAASRPVVTWTPTPVVAQPRTPVLQPVAFPAAQSAIHTVAAPVAETAKAVKECVGGRCPLK